jgi:hypothetical protein
VRIDKKLNLVVPIARDDGGTLYVHATPVSREAFETYFLPISVAFSRIWSEGLSVLAGPRVALKMLKKVSEDRNTWEGPEGVQAGLVEEIKRLTNVVVRTPTGWSAVPLYNAVQQDLLSEDELDAAENAVTFFILASAMYRKRELASLLEGMNDLWGTRSVLFNSTEFAASLMTSTEDENTGEKKTAVASSVPS